MRKLKESGAKISERREVKIPEKMDQFASEIHCGFTGKSTPNEIYETMPI
jgi:hypothetical protein